MAERRAGYGHIARSSGHHLAAGRFDQAALLTDDAVSGNQPDLPALTCIAGGDLAAVFEHDTVVVGVERVNPAFASDGVEAFECVVAGQKVVVADVQRGGNQARHVNPRSVAKQNAVGVQQKHPAVGFEVAQDLAGCVASDAVEHGTGRALLHEAHGVPGANAEAVPVDDGARGVGHLYAIGKALDANRAVDHCGSSRKRLSIGFAGQHGGEHKGVQSNFHGGCLAG